MQDLIPTTVEQIEKKRVPGIELGVDSIHPAYDGLSIMNVPSSISAWLGAGSFGHSPLQLPALDQLSEGVDQVVLLLVDAVSLHRCQTWLASSASKLNAAMQDGLITTLTSVVPSTTSAALTTLWTGRSPAEHGILGYELFLREFGMVSNMITHAPAVLGGSAGLLYEAGFSPEDFLPVSTIGPHLAQAGIESHAFLHQAISGSGLSRMHYPEVTRHTFRGIADLWLNVRRLVNLPLNSRRYIWVYYGGVDWISHLIGPDTEDAEITFMTFTDVLVQQYRITDPPLIHNMKVNAGLRPRGLCWHWAEDIENRLAAENFSTLEMHRAIANADVAFRIDHSTAIISRKGDDMYDGLVLDPWRTGGDLVWASTRKDKYRWKPQQQVLAAKAERLMRAN